MAITAALALQAALVARLAGYAPLSLLLGGPKVFDDVPRGTAAPYVTAAIETRDWSSQTSTGHEHGVTLSAWSRGRGRKQALDIMAEIEAALAGPALVLPGHALVDLRTLSMTAQRSGDFYRGLMRLRGVTEATM